MTATTSSTTSGVIAFVVPGQPVPKGRPRLALNGHVYTPPRTAEAEQRILAYLKAAWPHLKPLTGDVGLIVRAYLRGDPLGDWDNFGKCVSDALNGVVYGDDRQIRDAQVTLFRNSKSPRVEITVYPYPDLGRDGGEGLMRGEDQ